MKSIRIGVVALFAAFVLSGCTITLPLTITQTLTLVNDVVVPPNDQGLLESGKFEINDEYCALPTLDEIRELAEEHIAAFLAQRLVPQSIEISRVSFIASEGNFNSINRVEAIVWADGEKVIDAVKQAPDGGFGAQADLKPNVSPDLAKIIRDGVSCIQYYALMRGSMPDQRLVFKVEAELQMRFGIRVF